MCVFLFTKQALTLGCAVSVCAQAICGCVCHVRPLVLSCSLFVLKVMGTAEIESSLKDAALEQVAQQIGPLR